MRIKITARPEPTDPAVNILDMKMVYDILRYHFTECYNGTNEPGMSDIHQLVEGAKDIDTIEWGFEILPDLPKGKKVKK